MMVDYYKAGGALWCGIAAIWVLGMIRGKRTIAIQSRGARSIQTALSVLAFLLVFSQMFASGPLARPFMPTSELGSQVGLALTFIGLAFAAWARFQLGWNWSSDVTVKENHTLILKGPYAIVRHPIYTGFILGMLGMALIINEVRGVLGVIVLFVAFLLKSRNEESFMRQTFGEYPQYQRRVKALIPFIY